MSAAAMTIRPYRAYTLPWTPDPGEENRFRRVLWIVLVLFTAAAIIIPLLPVKEAPPPPPLPPEVVSLVLEPPPPPPKPELPKPEPKKPEVQPVPVPKPAPKPVDRVQQARTKAQNAGLLAMQDELKELREAFEPSQQNTRNLSAKVDGPSRAERNLITSNVGATSGGVNNAPSSRGFGAGPGSLKGVGTTQASPSFGDTFGRERAAAQRSGAGGKAARSREEVELMFDRNKSALYNLYGRSLRDNPALQGKLVVQLTISPWGEVTDCRVLSSELGDAELERKIVARIKLFKFEEKDVEALTARKTIDFFPG